MTARHPDRLEGEGLVLRPWDDNDLTRLVELFDDPDVATFTPLEVPFDTAAAREHLAGARRDRAGRHRVRLAITHDGGAALGEVLLVRDDVDPDGADLGYVVGPAYRGAGLAARALRVLTAWARDEAGLTRLWLRIQPGNGPSNAVARRAGYVPVPGPLVEEVLHGRSVSLRTWTHAPPE